MQLLEQLAAALREGEDERTAELTRAAVAAGIAPRDILDSGLVAGMNVVGSQFRDGDIFLPEVLLAARAMYAGLAILKPLLVKDNIPSLGRVVIGTVQGDLHDIGKNLVGIMLRGAGFDVIDLGNDVAPERFVDTALKENCGAIGLSALLTTTMPGMKRVVELLQQRNARQQVKVVIGGAPVTPEYCREIGADGYAFDAAAAVDKVRELLSK